MRNNEVQAAANEQARRAMLAGVLTCGLAGLIAFDSDLAWDAFKMAFGLTVVVPPVILLVGWLFARNRPNRLG